MNPTVSIITANYNKARFISETAHSVLNQSYKNWEWLIIDDNSTDNSAQVINQFTHDKRIQVFKNNENKGANFCRNFGLQMAKGDYVVFLDADDLLDKFCLENRIKIAIEKPDRNLLVFAMGVFKKEIGDDSRKWLPKSKNPLQDFLQHKLPWSIMQPLWKRDFLLELKGFDETFERLQDVELHTRALFHPAVSFKQIICAPDCYYRIDERRTSHSAYEMMCRYVNSASAFFNKFYFHAKERDLETKLLGTVYKVLQLLLFQYKSGSITKREFEKCKKVLFSEKVNESMGLVVRTTFSFAEFYNLLPIRIPGINWVLFNICKQ